MYKDPVSLHDTPCRLVLLWSHACIPEDADFDEEAFTKELTAEVQKMSDQGSETTSTFDETSVEVQSLKQNLKRLEVQLATKDEIIKDMHAQIKAMRAMHEEDAEDEEEEQDANASRIPGDTPAVRQRVRRLCRRRANGKLVVPEAVHEAWQNPGPQRDNLIRVYLANGCDKVRLGEYKTVYFTLVGMYIFLR